MEQNKAAFLEELETRTKKLTEAITAYLPEETGFQKTLLAACNYSVVNGGKRLRPLFMQLSYELCKERAKEADKAHKPNSMEYHEGAAFSSLEEERNVLFPFAAAIEMIHASSLVHDDLPCMDNDRLRRGKLSTWAKFGEDMGTLAGDGLMFYALETACKSEAEPVRKIEAIRVLVEKTGIFGMIGGQSLDVELTGEQPNPDELSFIYHKKTGALLEAAFMIGGILAGAEPDEVKRLEEAAGAIGMAFQIQDDILDETATEEELGKPTGSDDRNKKTTWLTHYGMEQAKEDVRSFTEQAVAKLQEIGNMPFLTALCTWLIDRRK